jgi:L-alanine-DL-glutamate epimerase-like enolase superfamily enzyme
MKLHLLRWQLPLAHAFTISRESMNFQRSLIVGLEHDGHIGYGEVTENLYYGHALADIEAAVRRAETWLPYPSAVDPAELWPQLLETVGGDTFAASAIDMAAHDWFGKKQGRPTWQVWGLSWNDAVTSSFTIGIDTVEGTADKVRRAQGYKVLKIKVGGASDLERLEAVRAGFDGLVRIDGNEGWDIEIARAITPDLIRLGVEFVEQPFHRDDVDAYRAYRELDRRLPVILDESCQEARDVPLAAAIADGVNIKIAKTGGIRGGFSLARAARAHGLAVMIGCMIESELGIGQAAQIASLCDHVDLDGHLLINDGPYRGLGLDDGVVGVSHAPGIGVEAV